MSRKPRNEDVWNRHALISVVVCAALVAVGLVRFASYSLGVIGDAVRNSVLGFLAYDPSSRANAQFFKILATPTVVAGIYFLVRWRNAAWSRGFARIDFKSPILRAIVTTVITLHWFAMEWWKFNIEGFYPWSPFESRVLNIAVLLAGQVLAFVSMKYLSFDPVRRHDPGSPAAKTFPS